MGVKPTKPVAFSPAGADGSAYSKMAANYNDSLKSFRHTRNAENAPFATRRRFIKEIKRLLKDPNNQRLAAKIKQLEKSFGISDDDVQPGGNEQEDAEPGMRVDETSKDLITTLKSHLAVRGERWLEEANTICLRIFNHVSPSPRTMGKLPDLTEEGLTKLNLTGVDLSQRTEKYAYIAKLLRKNDSIWSVDLGFTGLTNENLRLLLKELEKMPNLTYLGLRGNKLESSIIGDLMKVLKGDGFPKLRWVELKNNVDIYTVPLSLLAELKSRFPTDGSYIPSFQDLAEGRAVVLEDMMEIDL